MGREVRMGGSERLRIAVISTTTYCTPPKKYGGEMYFWLLAKGLAELGHEVYLYATPGSKRPPNGHLRLIPSSYGYTVLAHEFRVWKWYRDELLKMDFIIDCSHNHIPAERIRFFHRDKMNRIVNVLNGLVSHVPRPIPYNLVVGTEKWKRLLIEGKSQFYGTEYEEMYGKYITPVPPKAIVAVIPWAIDTDFYRPNLGGREDWYLWFSRPSPYKGLGWALDIAERTGIRLKVLCGVVTEEHKYWLNKFKPRIEKMPNVELIINPTHEEKMWYMQNARALLFTIRAHEPFGLVPIEAMACGCPVIATRLGSMPELIREGGVLCDTLDEFVEVVESGAVDAKAGWMARKNAERYDYRRIVPLYVELYRKMVGGGG